VTCYLRNAALSRRRPRIRVPSLPPIFQMEPNVDMSRFGFARLSPKGESAHNPKVGGSAETWSAISTPMRGVGTCQILQALFSIPKDTGSFRVQQRVEPFPQFENEAHFDWNLVLRILRLQSVEPLSASSCRRDGIGTECSLAKTHLSCRELCCLLPEFESFQRSRVDAD